MVVGSEWAQRNLGIEEAAAPAGREEGVAQPTDQEIARELIDFDSETPDLAGLGATVRGASTGMSRFVNVDWPAGLSPEPGKKPTGESLPDAGTRPVRGDEQRHLMRHGAFLSELLARKLIGDCVEMPSDLMAETALLRFVSYDPSGKGSPLLLAYTKDMPLWGHERWGFALRSSGARLFLRDAMDPRCREGF